ARHPRRWVSDFRSPKVSDFRPPLTTRRDRGGPRDRRAVLNAFRRRRFHHSGAARPFRTMGVRACSTPFGVEGSITLRAAQTALVRYLCSPPFGVEGSIPLSGEQTAVLLYLCSTPFGGEGSIPGGARQSGAARAVLNAFRRRRFHHSKRATRSRST